MSKEKQSEKIQDALYYLDDELIEEVGYLREREEKKDSEKRIVRRTYWRKWTALAASICLLLIGNWVYRDYIQPMKSFVETIDMNRENLSEDRVTQNAGSENFEDESTRAELNRTETDNDDLAESVDVESVKSGVTIPQMKVDLQSGEEVAADMLGFFILNGRSYIQYELHQEYEEDREDFVGDYVGYITGQIDEWTESDGYVEGAGTYSGNVYEVKGVDPGFMLCMVWENGWVETFINHNDITLYNGADLVDNRLDLRENYDAILLEKIVDHQFVYEPLGLSEEEIAVFDRFLDAFAEGDYVYVEEKVDHPFGGDWDTSDMKEFYFRKENGVRLRFRTLGDGYVSFPWIDACVKIDQGVYDEVVEILQKYEN